MKFNYFFMQANIGILNTLLILHLDEQNNECLTEFWDR